MSGTRITDQVAMSCGQVEISTNNADWTDISGEVSRFANPESARMIGEAYTQAGDTALLAAGKREPIDIAMDFIYTEADAEAYEVLRGYHETDCGDLVYVRWSPRGGSAGHEQITSGGGYITNFQYPGLDASVAGVIVVSVTFRVPSLTTAIIAS